VEGTKLYSLDESAYIRVGFSAALEPRAMRSLHARRVHAIPKCFVAVLCRDEQMKLIVLKRSRPEAFALTSQRGSLGSGSKTVGLGKQWNKFVPSFTKWA